MLVLIMGHINPSPKKQSAKNVLDTTARGKYHSFFTVTDIDVVNLTGRSFSALESMYLCYNFTVVS